MDMHRRSSTVLKSTATGTLLSLLLSAGLTGCVSELEKVNFEVNRFPYCHDTTPQMSDIRQTGCGDCEDYAYAKCLILKEKGYQVTFLYRSNGESGDASDTGHVALAVNGQTLDNQFVWPYPLKEQDWTYSQSWNCE